MAGRLLLACRLMVRDLAGLVWVDSRQIGALADAQPLSYTLNLRLADPHASTSFDHMSRDGIEYTSWMHIADTDGRLVKKAHLALPVGSWLRSSTGS